MALKLEQISVMNQHYQEFSFEYFLQAQQKLGIRFIELWCGVPHVFLDNETRPNGQALKKKVGDYGLQIGSIVCPSFAYHYQFATAQAEYYDRTLSYFLNGLHLAHDLEAGVMGVNSGWGLLDEPVHDAWKRSRELLAILAEAAEKLGVRLAMESLKDDESNLVTNLKKTERMIREIDHINLYAMVDTIAMGAAGEKLQDWFDVFADRVIHLHFLDGDPHVHNIWGDGNFPLSEMVDCLEANNYQGFLVQEIADDRYFSDPVSADERNLKILKQYIA